KQSVVARAEAIGMARFRRRDMKCIDILEAYQFQLRAPLNDICVDGHILRSRKQHFVQPCAARSDGSLPRFKFKRIGADQRSATTRPAMLNACSDCFRLQCNSSPRRILEWPIEAAIIQVNSHDEALLTLRFLLRRQ